MPIILKCLRKKRVKLRKDSLIRGRRRRVELPPGLAVIVLACAVGCDRGPGPPERDSAADVQPAGVPVADTTSPPRTADRSDQRSAAVPPLSIEIPEALDEIAAMIVRGEAGKARVRLRNHLDKDPRDGHAVFLFGLSYHREKRYGEARPHFEQALALAPGFVLTSYYHGWTLYYLGELTAARGAFERFATAQPGQYDARYALGLIALDEGRFEEADAELTEALRLLESGPDRDDAKALSKVLTRLGEISAQRGELAEARTRLERAAALYPDHYETLYKLYRVLVRLDEIEEAERIHAQYLATRARVRPQGPPTSFPE